MWPALGPVLMEPNQGAPQSRRRVELKRRQPAVAGLRQRHAFAASDHIPTRDGKVADRDAQTPGHMVVAASGAPDLLREGRPLYRLRRSQRQNLDCRRNLLTAQAV